MREAMSIMGMKIRNYYFTWFVRYYLVYICMHFICSLIITNQLPHIPFYVPFIVFVLFDLVLIIQNFFIQVFLTRAKIGVVISLLFFVLQYVLSFISANSNNPSLSVNASISIIPHAAFILAFQTMLYAESNQITPNFSDTLNHYVIGYALVSFVVNSIVYLILTWYLDQVVPNEWGAKKHPLFCCVNKGSSLTLEQK